jgi:hypothetical protein
MTAEQYFLILGTIYIAPHMSPIYCSVMGSLFMLGAACKALGWI